MNYSKAHPLLLVIAFMLMSACQPTSSKDELDYVPGDVIIQLEAGVTESDIKPRIDELGLNWEEYFEYVGSALIGVPIGEEEMWVQVLKDEPTIKYASLNRKVELRHRD